MFDRVLNTSLVSKLIIQTSIQNPVKHPRLRVLRNVFAKHSILDVWQGSEYASTTHLRYFIKSITKSSIIKIWFFYIYVKPEIKNVTRCYIFKGYLLQFLLTRRISVWVKTLPGTWLDTIYIGNNDIQFPLNLFFLMTLLPSAKSL